MKSHCVSVNIRRIRDRIRALYAPFSQDRITVYAAQASFFISISAIPLVMLILHGVQWIFPALHQNTMDLLQSVLPPVISNLVTTVVEELYGKANFSVISFSAITLLWAAARGIKSIGHGVRNIFGSRAKSGFWQNIFFSLLLTVGFVLFLIAAIAFVLFGKMAGKFILQYLPISDAPAQMFVSLRLPVFFAILVLLFWFAYQGMARIRCPFRTHFPGAVLSAAGWVIFSWLFSLYIENYADYSYLYGSLAAVILLMLWIYFCMLIFLCGAECNKLLLLRKEQKAK